jgi:hypothetical protein
VLRACRRVLRPGGRLAFYTILTQPGLSDSDYRRALRLGPSATSSGKREQRELLRSVGFAEVSKSDVTPEFLSISRSRLEARERHATALRSAQGSSQFDEKQAEDRGQIEAIEAGLLRRALFVAERPR